MMFLLPKCVVVKAEMRFGFELKKRKENFSAKAAVLTVDNTRRILNS